MSRFMTVRECADDLQVSTKTIYRAVRSGMLDAYRIGGRLRINKVAVESYLAGCRTTAPGGGREDA